MAMAAKGAVNGRVHPTLPCLPVQVNAAAPTQLHALAFDDMQAGIGAC